MLKTIERLKENYSHAILTKNEALDLAEKILKDEIENTEDDNTAKTLKKVWEDINIENFDTDEYLDDEFDGLHFLTLDDIDRVIDNLVCFAYGAIENEQYAKERAEADFEN